MEEEKESLLEKKKENEKIKLRHSIRGNEGTIQSVIFSRDGKVIFSGGSDKTIKIWSS